MALVRMIKEEPELCIIDDPYISQICQWNISSVNSSDIESNKEKRQDSATEEVIKQDENEICNSNLKGRRSTQGFSNVCSVCFKTFRKVINYELHMSKVHNLKLYECSTCGMRFPQKGHLILHFRGHAKVHYCKHCTASFSRADQLKRHHRTHHSSRPDLIKTCSVCYKTFEKLPDYELHMSKVHNVKPYECSTCGMQFSRKAYLKPHFRVHTGEKPYPCKQCPAAFSRASDFKKHNRSHQGIRLFKCELCDKRFTRAFSLRFHLDGHIEKKHLVCKVCGIRFRKSSTYNYHKKTQCKNTFECVFCKKKFKSRDSTAYHVRKYH